MVILAFKNEINMTIEEQIYNLVKQNSTDNLYKEWKNLNLSDDCFLIKAKEDSTISAFSDIKSLNSEKYKVCPYFSANDLYFIDNSTINQHKKEEIKIEADYSFSFDSNICSFIHAIMSQKPNFKDMEFVRFIQQIIATGHNYDFTFYLLENNKQINLTKKYANENDFWTALNHNFKENIISLMKFRTIKKENYNSFLPEIDDDTAEKQAIDFSYKYYMNNNSVIQEMTRLKNVIKVILLGAIKIQFSSNKGYQNKFDELIDFMNNEIGIFYDRESRIMLEYFKDKNLKIFEKIKKPINDRQKFDNKVENIAWDLLVPRFMENLMISSSKREKFFVPFFISNDTALNEVLEIYKIKVFYFGKNHLKKENCPIPIFEKDLPKYFIDEIGEEKFSKLINNSEKRKEVRKKAEKELDKILEYHTNECYKIFNI